MLDILRNRRSARRFESTKIPGPVVQRLQEAVLRSPSSKNNRPWEFIFVDDTALIAQLSTCKPHGAAFLKDAPLAVVIVGDENMSDVWVEDCSIAAITLQYAAQAMDVGSCWVQVRKRKNATGDSAESVVKDLLQIPAQKRVGVIVALGYKVDHRDGVALEKLEFHKIKTNGYNELSQR